MDVQNSKNQFIESNQDDNLQLDSYSLQILDEHIKSITKLENNLTFHFSDLKNNIDWLIVEIAAKLTRFIIKYRNANNDDFFSRLYESLKKVIRDGKIEISVGPQNFRLVKSNEGKIYSALDSAQNVEILCDETISENNFRIESNKCIIDEDLFQGINKLEEILCLTNLSRWDDTNLFQFNNADLLENKIKKIKYLNGFEIIQDIDSNIISNVLQYEHPQTIALILSQLNTEKNTEILSNLPVEICNDVLLRINSFTKVEKKLIDEVESILYRLFGNELYENYLSINGLKYISKVFNITSSFRSKLYFKGLEKLNPELTEKVKNLLFNFNDLIYIENSGIQKIIRKLKKRELAAILLNAPDEVKDKFFQNMSSGAKKMIYEEIEIIKSGKEIDTARERKKIMDLVRDLEEKGEIKSQKGSMENIFSVL